MTLEKSIRRSEKSERAISAAYAALTRLDAGEPKSVIELRALEANCAAAYFRSWQGMPIKWRGTSRRPIPDNWNSIEQRSSPFHLAGNRNAAHPVNAILNYVYTVLESELRIKAIVDGFDPTIGVMHEGRDGSSKTSKRQMSPFDTHAVSEQFLPRALNRRQAGTRCSGPFRKSASTPTRASFVKPSRRGAER